MHKKEKIELAAVIDIGSGELRLKTAQFSKTRIKYLESLTYPLSLGRDTFNTGKIGFDKVEKACDIICNFMIIIREYGITNIRVVATTAVREATNMDIRSFKLNFECNAFIYNQGITKQLEEQFIRDINDSTRIEYDWYIERGNITKIRESVSRLLSPLL